MVCTNMLHHVLQLAIFVVLFLVIAGAWLGFWVVRKLVLTEDGDIDGGVAHFVAWSIRIFASVMILQVRLSFMGYSLTILRRLLNVYLSVV